MRRARSFLLVLLATLPAAPAGADPLDRPGEAALSAGITWAEGDVSRYGLRAFSVLGRVTLRPKPMSIFALWSNLSGNLFNSEEEVVSVPTDGGYMPATRSTTETAFALHLGVQLNPPAARSPIRPRVALGAGLWMFNSDIAYRVDREDDPFLSDDETSFEFGLRGNGGIDVFFAEKWGIALDFTFDRLFGVDRVVPTDDAGGGRPAAQTARYFSAALGLVAPLDRLF